MFRMLEKSRTPDKCKLRCRIASLILVSLMISLLWGCVSNGTENSTESVTKHSAEREETSPSDVLEESTMESTEASTSAPVSYITGSKKLEALVPALWGRMIFYCGMSSVCKEDYTIDTWDQMHKDYAQVQYNADYSVEVYLIDIATSQVGFTEVYVFYDHFGNVHRWRWNERDDSGNRLKVTPELYTEAEKYWESGLATHAIDHYLSGGAIIPQQVEASRLKVSGTVRKVFDEKRIQQWDENALPIYLWGSVIKEIGKYSLEKTGTVLGELSGEVYLMDFNFETCEAKFWICQDGAEPIEAYFDYTDESYVKYTFQFDETAVWNESEKEKAWASLEFDLVTEKLK